MPWGSNFIAVSGGAGGSLDVTFSVNQTDLNLFTFLGSPPLASVVNMILDGADIRTFDIGSWPNSSVINITVINSGRILGRGGVGGAGGGSVPYGHDENEGQNGGAGTAGGHALSAPVGTFIINLNLDAGYCWGGGGGGGGGGGSSGSNGGGNYGGGGGGGGGMGWDDAAGGLGGYATRRPGNNGSQATQAGGPGTGGFSGRHIAAGHSVPDGDGSIGGDWGLVGTAGIDCWQFNVAFPLLDQTGGAAGGPGSAIQAATTVINFVGALNEATLIGTGRIVGASNHL
jgi:hypothetical protein